MLTDIKGYFPTPLHIVNKMVDGIDFHMINSVLEPSAGEGHIVKIIYDKMNYCTNSYNRDKYIPDIDCIEINESLRYILKGKGYRVIHDDFLTLETYKQYDLIIMNPEFENGDKHLLKALEMQKNGGNIVCLLNAETIKNPYSNIRKELKQKLDEANAIIEFIPDAFYNAERKTGVEIALIKIHIPEVEKESYIYEQLKQEEIAKEIEQPDQYYSLVHNDFVKTVVAQYNLEVKAGSKLINEYWAMKPLILTSFDKEDKYIKPILKLDFEDTDRYGSKLTINEFIKRVRYKYWKTLFDNKEFTGALTENLRTDYYKRITELAEYDFSLFNIYTIKIEMSKNMVQGVEETILNLFDEFSHKHYWDADTSANIHYYNGWKTNSSWKINKKVIIPLNGFHWYNPNQLDYDYKVKNKLSDIEKVFNYLDGGLTTDVNLEEQLKFAQGYGDNKKIPLKYFMVTFYKKGTCHIEFTNLELLAKFNLFASQRKGWLPQSYGKKQYSEMNREEKAVIDEYEGREEYNKVMQNKDYFLVESSQLLQLGA